MCVCAAFIIILICVLLLPIHGWKVYQPDDHALILHLNQHVPIHVVSKGIHMRGVFILSLSCKKKNYLDSSMINQHTLKSFI